jgi:predicted nucleic acid-binding protein
MKLVLDTNIIISALVKDGFTRDFLINQSQDLEFCTPAHTLTEIIKYKEEICRKSKMNERGFYTLLEILFKYIRIINPVFYYNYLKKAKVLIEHSSDAPFLACAIALDCSVWSDDKHFQKQKIVKILTTKDMVNLGG